MFRLLYSLFFFFPQRLYFTRFLLSLVTVVPLDSCALAGFCFTPGMHPLAVPCTEGRRSSPLTVILTVLAQSDALCTPIASLAASMCPAGKGLLATVVRERTWPQGDARWEAGWGEGSFSRPELECVTTWEPIHPLQRERLRRPSAGAEELRDPPPQLMCPLPAFPG